MLFFPKSEDTSDLKILINYEILTDIKRHGKLKTEKIVLLMKPNLNMIAMLFIVL